MKAAPVTFSMAFMDLVKHITVHNTDIQTDSASGSSVRLNHKFSNRLTNGTSYSVNDTFYQGTHDNLAYSVHAKSKLSNSNIVSRQTCTQSQQSTWWLEEWKPVKREAGHLIGEQGCAHWKQEQSLIPKKNRSHLNLQPCVPLAGWRELSISSFGLLQGDFSHLIWEHTGLVLSDPLLSHSGQTRHPCLFCRKALFSKSQSRSYAYFKWLPICQEQFQVLMSIGHGENCNSFF